MPAYRRDFSQLPDAMDADSFFGREIDYNGTIYTVNQHKSDRFTVWKDGQDLPYTTLLRPYYCDCPDWQMRRRATNSPCKHHRIVNLFLQGKDSYSDPKPPSKSDPYTLNSDTDEELLMTNFLPKRKKRQHHG